jgi:hypothetical protein
VACHRSTQVTVYRLDRSFSYISQMKAYIQKMSVIQASVEINYLRLHENQLVPDILAMKGHSSLVHVPESGNLFGLTWFLGCTPSGPCPAPIPELRGLNNSLSNDLRSGRRIDIDGTKLRLPTMNKLF